MPDPCSPGLPPPRSSEVSIPISTASSLRTSNGCNWLLQKFILRKESGGSRGGSLGEWEAAAVMRFWKLRCHPRGWQGEGRLASPCARSRRRTKRRLKTSLAECGCHTTVANTQQRSRHSRHLSLPSPRRLWATFTALPPPALSTAGGPLPRRHPGAGFCSAGGETEAEGQGSQGPRAPGLLLQRLCHRLGPLCRAVTPSGASASGRPPTPPPRLPTLCPAGPAHAPGSL